MEQLSNFILTDVLRLPLTLAVAEYWYPNVAITTRIVQVLDLIYIIDEPLASISSGNGDGYIPNFVMGGQRQPQDGKVSEGVAAGTASGAAAAAAGVAGVALAFVPFSLPVSLIAAALVSAPRLFASFSKEDKSGADGSASVVPVEGAKMLAEFAERHAMTRSKAKEAGYKFQPGHPIVGKDYRRHPLAEADLYIPNDSYDAILLEERESELIKLLVHLGATKITITKKAADKTQREMQAKLAVQARVAGAELGASSNSDSETNVLDTREFSLSGRSWKGDSKVDNEKFFWLPYEPSWKAVVFAREEGGCLTASLEIKETTSLSSNKNLELSVKAKLAEVGASLGVSDFFTEEKTYHVKAEFSSVQQPG
ncbi:hypothetical protein ACQZ2G_04735 [Pseudomonas viridiflava]|uniref:hypothetical protein n=1 Tax=Pseudomonas viridiflava TaxID=33069 RepID=UPI001F13C7A4|nr:hypothetical protein [Pseudomonas viridiflava]